MGRELVKIVELDASPEQVWEAIATGPGISAWFVPHQVEERQGGAMSAQFGGGFEVTGEVRAWEPGQADPLRGGRAAAEGAADYAFEFLVEGRDGGGTVLRFVQSGFLDEGWEDEYSSLDKGWDLFFGNLRSYLDALRRAAGAQRGDHGLHRRARRPSCGRCCTGRSGWAAGPPSARP